MTKNQFIHVADVHLDSPLSNLKRLDETTANRLRDATRKSFENVVDLALAREVAGVVIAGDLFDGPVKDSTAGIWVEAQLRRLSRAGIQVALIRGNHDANSNARKIAQWPERIFEFGTSGPSTVIWDEAGIAVHGQSFSARCESEDMAAQYPDPVMGMLNIGLLHTSLAGSASHDTYAPTSIDTLENKGYEFWALGHIHIRTPDSLSERCYVGFSGNTQGRHIREAGAKGCSLVSFSDGKITDVEFVATDCFRWHEIEADISNIDSLADIEDLLEEPALDLSSSAEGRPLAVRVNLHGATELHAELLKFGVREQLTQSIGSRLSEFGQIWLEKIKVNTTAYFAAEPDESQILPLKYLSQVSSSMKTNPSLREDLGVSLEELLKKSRQELAEYGFGLARQESYDAELTRFITEAEQMLASRLAGASHED